MDQDYDWRWTCVVRDRESVAAEMPVLVRGEGWVDSVWSGCRPSDSEAFMLGVRHGGGFSVLIWSLFASLFGEYWTPLHAGISVCKCSRHLFFLSKPPASRSKNC
jgi:hypothetical protein